MEVENWEQILQAHADLQEALDEARARHPGMDWAGILAAESEMSTALRDFCQPEAAVRSAPTEVPGPGSSEARALAKLGVSPARDLVVGLVVVLALAWGAAWLSETPAALYSMGAVGAVGLVLLLLSPIGLFSLLFSPVGIVLLLIAIVWLLARRGSPR